MTEGLAIAREIVSRHREAADRDRRFHKARGPRLQNVEACLAACKVGWLDAILREIDAIAPRPVERTEGR